MRWRILTLWITALAIVAWTGLLVVQKEQILATGRPVLLELAPVDPRSLIQGDYMVLRYAVLTNGADGWPAQGRLIATLDARGVVQRVDLYDGQRAVAADQQLLSYHTRGQQLLIGAESYFFQEGTAATYDQARYGELRATPNGDNLLVGLRDEQLQPLGAPVP